MKSLAQKKIGEIVADDYRTAGVFRSLGLDFCCGGGKTVAEACEKKGINLTDVQEKLSSLDKEGTDKQNYNAWSPDFLIDYIVNNHHAFVREKLPEIEFYAKKVAKVHGDQHRELKDILFQFLALKEELLDHLDKEEQLLFPYIKALIKWEHNKDKKNSKPYLGSAEKSIEMMEAEHEEAGKVIAKIRRLSNNFNPPEDACTTYRIFYQNLEGFENDLHKHVHLENNILFPKALGLHHRLN